MSEAATPTDAATPAPKPTHLSKADSPLKVGDRVVLHGVVTALYSGDRLDVMIDGEPWSVMLGSGQMVHDVASECATQSNAQPDAQCAAP